MATVFSVNVGGHLIGNHFKFYNNLFKNTKPSKMSDSKKITSYKITKTQSDIISESLEHFHDKTEFSIALIENDEVNFFGLKKQKGSINRINNQNSLFKIGSITKLFTSTILSDLVVAKKVQLEDTIDSFLSFSINNKEKITLLSLANHTSGISEPSFDIICENTLEYPLAHFDENKLISYLKKELIVEPSKKNPSYLNVGYVILGYVLEKIENKKYCELIDQYVFSKYGMRNSSLIKDKINGKVVSGIDQNGKEIITEWENITYAPAGEKLVSNVIELSNFVIQHFNEVNKALILTRKSTVSRDEKIEIGLGWAILKNEDDTKYHFHPGGLRGYRSCLAIDEINKTGVIILSNVSCFHKKSIAINQLCFDLMATLNKNEPPTQG